MEKERKIWCTCKINATVNFFSADAGNFTAKTKQSKIWKVTTSFCVLQLARSIYYVIVFETPQIRLNFHRHINVKRVLFIKNNKTEYILEKKFTNDCFPPFCAINDS